VNYIAFEVNFDGLVGPTHNYSGLSLGNVASMQSKGDVSNPKEAALQGLEKMRFLAGLGVKQAVLPPQERPHIPTLNRLGFTGTVEAVLKNVKESAPWLLNNCCSASSMWAANAATVSPSVDSVDTHVHFTPANLSFELHRSIEAETTSRLLKAIFPNPVYFQHHQPLQEGYLFSDEGAANHTRFCRDYNGPGVQLFVWGRTISNPYVPTPRNFPARYSLEAAQAIARLHQLYPKQVVFAQQNPQAIDLGVFHNDVIAVGNRNFFFYHELAYIDSAAVIKELQEKVRATCDTELFLTEVAESRVSLQEAVKSYLFNSQVVSLPDGSMHLIAPKECEGYPNIVSLLDEMREDADNPIRRIHFVNLLQSMKNGGGPACLRLRVVLNENELRETNPGVFMNDTLYTSLVSWVNRFYRDQLSEKDLADPKLQRENQEALDTLTQILNLGSIYSFQR
jgi:succinylarginine dihydrolase